MPLRLSQLIPRCLAPGYLVLAGILFTAACALAANDSRPVVGPGATKDDVINAYGWPNGQSQSGTKEILNYAQGDVVLEHGRVERVNFSPDVPWQTPRPRPPAATTTTRKVTETPVDFWMTSYATAMAEAHRRHVAILALFTGSDWSPASREFHEQVEFHPDFVNAFAGDFVFLKLDYPRGSPVPAKISDENLRLRDRYNVTTYPTLLVLAANGDLLARVDLMKPATTGSFRDRVIAAVREARDATATIPEPALVAPPVAPPPPVVAPSAPAVAPVAASTSSSGNALSKSDTAALGAVWTAGKLIAVALGAGVIVIFLLWWWMWRQPKRKAEAPVSAMADRIDAAAGGMPLPAEMSGWTKEKLRTIVAALAEFDNYTAHLRPSGQDVDLELRKRGDVNPRVLVCCAAGAEGTIAAKRLRELFATLTAEGVDYGWYVSPAGFSADAREYAAAHRIALVGSDGLHNMMREVPPVSLPAVLARG